MQIANAGKQLNAPRSGVQKVFNADGTVTEIPYMEDRFGRRTVMTREGPRVIPGHEGKDVYGDLGGKIGNVLGGLINKGRLGRQERIAEKSVAQQERASFPRGPGALVLPPAPENLAELNRARERLNYKPPQEKLNYFDMSSLGPKAKTTLGTIELPDGSFGIKRTTIDAQGNPRLIITDPNTGATLYDSGAKESATAQPPPSTNRFAAVPKPLNASEQKIQDYLPEFVSVDGRPGTIQATTEQRQAARVAADKKPIKRADVDYSAALLLSEPEAQQYMSGTLSDEDFRKLHIKAMTLKAKEPKKKSEGMMDKERAFSQMQLAMPTLAKYEADPQFVKSIAGYSGAMARNFRATADADERMYLQAADAWVRAKLRDESGAAISEDEMAKEYSTFFPQFNDTPEVIAEKARMRDALTEQMGSASGVINPSEAPPPGTDSDLTPLVVGNIEIVIEEVK